MSRILFFAVTLILLSFYGCNVTVIESKAPEKLYIASDFLTPADSVFFKDFRKKESVKIVILSMSADSAAAHYHQFGYNSRFDIVLMKSIYALDVLSKNNVLHTLPKTHLWKNEEFSAPHSDWIILGLDPYVVGCMNDEKSNFQYNELTYGHKWTKELNDEEIAAFQASVLFQFGRKSLNKSLSWLEKIESQSINQSDTTVIAPYCLTRLSKINESHQSFVYPNQSLKFGVFYDGIGMGIVRHSSKYIATLSFIEYYSNLVYNQKLCNHLGILPVQNPNGLSAFPYQNEYPILFRCTPKKIVPLFRDLKRIRNRI